MQTKNRKNPTDLRPIYLLNTMLKLLKKLLLSRLKMYIMPKIHLEHNGYRSEHSAINNFDKCSY